MRMGIIARPVFSVKRKNLLLQNIFGLFEKKFSGVRFLRFFRITIKTESKEGKGADTLRRPVFPLPRRENALRGQDKKQEKKETKTK
ncbi:MAG: hypothetical protein IJR89_06610 [Clostridia bacterium]|nr:hypothetical protein [Clostridia bacterium]